MLGQTDSKQVCCVPMSLIGRYIFRQIMFAFALTLVPVVGALLGPAFQLWSTSRALTWELLDPYFDRRSFGYAEQRAYLKAHSGPIVGFGLPLSFILAVPLVGPLFFGLAQAGAALLVVEVLEPEG